MNLLERAGLVRRVDDPDDMAAGAEGADTSSTGSDPAGAHHADPAAESSTAQAPAFPAADAAPPVEESTGMTLEQVYTAAGVPPCAYPAERLLRLLDGLKAMDPALRHQTIQAIDAADDSWSIEDPQRDAAAKVAAIEAHAASIRIGLNQAEQETQALVSELTQRQDTAVAEIRRQIADLEGLLAREIARGAQQGAGLESALQTKRENANRELRHLAQAMGELNALIAQFGGAKTT
ncbi:methyl-accepting chemotaxis protein [Aquabacterium sp.]|uniref:methyl-accepting chemotaxis protein n=1 Tax=Aquabacterium sp. TaxID=1872578 RepID=UPI002CE6EC9F|nr:methyl-accepting chemotaxis protein [Aquabacterium sp.]HSW06760.1 methyl-accepting chemotaxis protein [Aquabacterium sp.]